MVTFWILPLSSGHDSISLTGLPLSLYFSCAWLVVATRHSPSYRHRVVEWSRTRFHLPYGMVPLWTLSLLGVEIHPGPHLEVWLWFRPDRHIYTLKASRFVMINVDFDFWPRLASWACDLCSYTGLSAWMGPAWLNALLSPSWHS